LVGYASLTHPTRFTKNDASGGNKNAHSLFHRPRHRHRSAKRKVFDAWYSREHLPDATKSFGASKAWRFWSTTDPSLHQAMYQFADEASLDRAVNGAEMKRLIADFNRDWPDVTRTRETLVLAEEVAAG
jgi:hypothetical protein